MKRFLASSFVLLTMVLGGCGYSEPEELESVSDDLADELTVFVTAYKEEMIQAINENKTDRLEEEFLIPNTSFYHALHRYREDLQKNGSFKELVSFEVESAWYEPDEGDYFVDATEEVRIITGDESEEIKRHVRFHVVEGSDDSYRLYAIIDQTNK